MCDNNDIEDDFPIVVVTNIDSKHSQVELGQHTNQEKRFVLHAADGDDNIITILMGRMGMIDIGSVIELLSFRRGFRPRVDNETPERMAVLVSNFRPRGSMEVKESLKQMPTERLTVEHPNEDTEDDEMDDDDSSSSSSSSSSDDDSYEDGSEDGGEPRWTKAVCTSNKRLCHKHGYGFDLCVTEAYTIREFDLEEIAGDPSAHRGGKTQPSDEHLCCYRTKPQYCSTPLIETKNHRCKNHLQSHPPFCFGASATEGDMDPTCDFNGDDDSTIPFKTARQVFANVTACAAANTLELLEMVQGLEEQTLRKQEQAAQTM